MIGASQGTAASAGFAGTVITNFNSSDRLHRLIVIEYIVY